MCLSLEGWGFGGWQLPALQISVGMLGVLLWLGRQRGGDGGGAAGQGPRCSPSWGESPWSCGAGCQGLCLGFPFKQQRLPLGRVKVFSGGSGQMQDAEAAQPCCMSPPPRCGIPGPAGLRGPGPGQERGCETNHSCNMRESTWSLRRSLKTLRLWQAGPGLLPEGLGVAAAGGCAGAELLQDVRCNVSRTAREHCGAFLWCWCHGETPCQQDLPKPACRLRLPLGACGQLGSAAADPPCRSKA